MSKAVKKIKKGIQQAPGGARDPDNWIIWGLILRYHGNYKSARHKFLKAIKVDPENITAKQELQMVDRIIQLDSEIPIDAVPNNN
jgi:cytochrome c-type biogenesis protein CcmH/NrfG